MNDSERINELKEAWEQSPDSSVIKAATKNWDEYPSHVQAVIETEAKDRGLWEKVLYLRGEKKNAPEKGNLEGYFCEGCNGTYLNFETGRCANCDLPADNRGYCIKCDKFWSLQPGQMCPEHGTKLVRHKAAMAMLRFGNLILDTIIFKMLAYVTMFILVILLVLSGLMKPDSFENTDPVIDWLIGISLLFLYDFIFEAIWQRSPAKFITGTKVVTSAGGKPPVGTIAKRALIRFVPFDPISFGGHNVRGWHDKWSGTYVIKAKRFEKKSIDHNQIVTRPQPSFAVETPEKSVDILSVSNRKVEVCKNCGRIIGKLEQAYVFKNHIVCQQCHEKLKKQI